MAEPVIFTEIWRGDFRESVHRGHAVVSRANGDIVLSLGDPDAVILPRSSAKMIQALPLIESGAAAALGLTPAQLALACASHSGAPLHTQATETWLKTLGLLEDDLLCGVREPLDPKAHLDLVRDGGTPCQLHSDCSGKHAGFLTLAQHLGVSTKGYVDPNHAVQKSVLEAFERVTDAASPGFGVDGCSAPNFATKLRSMARAMAHFAAAPEDSAEHQLVTAMMAHPEYVAGEGRACTRLMRAAKGQAAVKTGAEAVFVGIVPDQKLGISLKIEDGSTRAAECAIAALLVRLGVLSSEDPEALAFINAPQVNPRGILTGHMTASEAILPLR